jgi:magnesium-transporting ATPase (P-type)
MIGDTVAWRFPGRYWSIDRTTLLTELQSGEAGLSSREAASRLRACGPNALREANGPTRLEVLGRQLRNPLLLLLVFAAAVSGGVGEWLDATIVFAIVGATAGIGYSREYTAHAAAAALRARVHLHAVVLRDGRLQDTPVDAVVPGDVVALSAGSLVPADCVLTGRDLDELHDEALWAAAEKTDLFVEVDPNHKEPIILALKKMGHVVGFLGDGINDAPAMHAAHTSLSVDQAVDVAREAADFVLLERGLDVIRRGVERRVRCS